MSQAGEARPTARARGEAMQHRRVLQIAKRLSATLGVDFFQSLVKNLSEVLRVECVYLAELTGTSRDRLRTLAVIQDRNPAPGFEQKVSGTASGQALSDGVFACTKDVLSLFPQDAHLHEIAAEGYAGIRLSDTAGQVLGVLAIAGREPLADAQLAKSVLAAFAPRAAAELERKRNDDLHRESEERYQAFITNNPDAMWRLEFDQPVPLDQPEDEVIEQLYRFGYLAEYNEATARLFGRERPEQMAGLPLEAFAPRADRVLQEELRSAIRSNFRENITERVISDEDGRLRYRLRSQFGIVENGHVRRLWGSTRDITSLREAELAASVSERRFREVLEGIQLPAVMLNTEGAMTFCNDSFVRLARRSKSELGAMPWLDGIVPAKESAIWRSAISPEPAQGKLTSHFDGEIIVDGSVRFLQWDTICLRDKDNRVGAIAAVGRDLTYQRALEVEVRQTQKLEGIGRLAAGIAHDFNNLLMLVLGNASLLVKQVEESDRTYAPLSEIVHAATHCARLTERLLALGRRQSIRAEAVDLNQVVEEVEGLLRSMAGPAVALNIDRKAQFPLVLADPTQLHEVLANLVTNARDAMPGGGRVSIATANLVIEGQDPDYPGVNPGRYVTLSVIDNGIGLTEEVQTHIFEPFFSTKEPGKGTGLGLPTVYAIVKQSGGHIVVRSVVHEGSTFEILLPAPPPADH